jgi:hypothetical protein
MLMVLRKGLVGVLAAHWRCLLGIKKNLSIVSSGFKEGFVIVDSFECAESEYWKYWSLSLDYAYGCLSNVNESEGLFSVEIDRVVT